VCAFRLPNLILNFPICRPKQILHPFNLVRLAREPCMIQRASLNRKMSRQRTSSNVTVISPPDRWKVLVSQCHLSTNVANRSGSRKEYLVCDSPQNPVAFSFHSHQAVSNCSCLKEATLPELLTGEINSRSCKINNK
jgi:hypothetical protein